MRGRAPLIGLMTFAVLSFSHPAHAAESNVQTAVDAITNNKPGKTGPQRLHRGEMKTFVFTEAEVNEYIAHWIAQEAEKKKEREVTAKSGVIHLEEGHVIQADAVARVGMGALKMLGSEADSVVVKTLKQYLTIDNSLHLKIMVSSAKGKIFVKVLGAKVKEVPLPDSLISKVLQVVGEKQHPKLDFNRLFPLPNGIQKVEVLPGQLKLQIRGL